MKKIAIFLFLSSPAIAAYNYTTPIIVNHGKVGGLETNFPVLVQSNSVVFSTSVSGGHMLNSNGYDLVFSTFSDCHYLLHWDSETVNNTGSATMNYWVNVPSLSNTNDAVFYMCYGNSGITTYQGISTATWDSNFSAIYHLADGSTLSGKDSSSLTNTLTLGNSPSAVAGKIDGAASLNGSTNYLEAADAVSVEVDTGDSATWEWWAKATVNNTSIVYEKLGAGSETGYQVAYITGTGVGLFLTSNFSGGNYTEKYYNGGTILDGNWHHYVVTYSGSSNAAGIKIYFDGTDTGVAGGHDALSASINNNAALDLGRRRNSNNLFWAGTMDEFRMSKGIVRSADWISTEFNNQNSPSTFIIFDTEVNNALLQENQNGLLIKGGKLNIQGGRVTIQ